METTTRARHRLGGKHSDPIIVPGNQQKKPSGRRSAALHPADEPVVDVVVPPKPDHAPVVHRVVIREVEDTEQVPVVAPADPVKAQTSRISVVRHKTAITALAAIATGGLLLVSSGSGVGGSAQAGASKTTTGGGKHVSTDLEHENAEPHPITAQIAVLSRDKVEVKTVPAPLPEPEPVVVAPTPVIAAQAPRHVAPAPVVPKPAPVAPAVPQVAVSNGKGAVIAQAARNQVGVWQDCTALASNSLAAAGMNVPRRWPWEYANLGMNVGPANAQAGDLLLYSAQNGNPAHIAVALGGGRAIHGGWNGNQTVEWSTAVGQPSFGPYAAIRVA